MIKYLTFTAIYIDFLTIFIYICMSYKALKICTIINQFTPAIRLNIIKMKQVPLLQVFLLFGAGVFTSEFSEVLPGKYQYLIIISLAVFTILLIILSRFELKILFIPLSIITIILSGFYSHQAYNDTNSKNHFYNYSKNSKSNLVGKIKTISKTKKGTKFILTVEQLINIDTDTINTSGNLLVYSNIKYDSSTYIPGDIIRLSCYISPIAKENNPLSFSPKTFYHFQNIHFQTYVKDNSLSLISKNKHGFYKYFYDTNISIKDKIHSVIEDDTLANIAISIILGDKQNIDRETLNTFAMTGSRHILTVSGMHVGIVALILNFIFSFYQSNTIRFRIIKITIILSGIWYYAFLTGTGAAILRASFMISLVLIGINLRRNVNIINLLFGSALILIIINPFLLFQLSFILSYSAMLSIFLFYNPVYNLINLKNHKILNYLWQLISLSIAAQILIFPLSIYYFHNAPMLFIITAIIATPLAFSSIAFGFIIVLFHSFIFYISQLSGFILEIIIKYSLISIRAIESISLNIGEYLYIETLELIIIFITIAFFTLYIHTKKIQYIYGGSILILVLISNQIWKNNIINNTDEIVFYSTSNHQLSDIFINGNCITINNDKMNDTQIAYSARNYRIYKQPSSIINIDSIRGTKHINKVKNIIYTPIKTIVFIQSKEDLFPQNIKDIDLLVLSSKIRFDIKELSQNYNIKQIVLSKNMKYKLRKYWIKQAKTHKIKVWDISTQGALITPLNI